MLKKVVRTKSWFELGLEELGLSLEEYKNLNSEEKKEVDSLLKEMGHGRVEV